MLDSGKATTVARTFAMPQSLRQAAFREEARQDHRDVVWSGFADPSVAAGCEGCIVTLRTLLIIGHVPSPNTQRLRDAVLEGALAVDAETVAVDARSPFDTTPHNVKAAAALVLGTTENLGYMSGALKDFFDRCYYPCLEETRAKPYALYIRAGLDGTGTRRAVESIAGGLGWRAVSEPLLLKGEWQDDFAGEAHELGMLMAAGLDAGIF